MSETTPRKKILLSNDDGIYAPGLRILAEALRPDADVTIVAPDREQSAVGHAITIYDPLKVKECYNGDAFLGYAVSGTPADCVKLALSALMPTLPDIVISGINQGPNLGMDIIYSGTVSAATEGAFLGIQSIAISIHSFARDAHFATAAQVVRELLDALPSLPLPLHDLVLNVNVPNLPHKELQGWRMTYQGRTRYKEEYVQRHDPHGNAYYWVNGTICEEPEDLNADYCAVKNGFVSVTPLHFDVSHHACIRAARDGFETHMNAQ